MSGGGRRGPSYFPSRPAELKNLIKETREDAEEKRLESDVNEYLQAFLVKLNQRNPEKVQAYIDETAEILGETYEIEKLLFGGSVAKHTAVDGLSDVDALVVLNKEDLQRKAPREVLDSFFDSLQGNLPRDRVVKVEKGDLAVTISYEDGTEIQLLPALRRGREICIADADGHNWKVINPKVFQRELTKSNERLNGALVPTIKLLKSILSVLPKNIKPTGYHIESLSVDVTKGYRGPKTVKSLLLHILTGASARVLHPIADITNQSKIVDAYLGKKNSEQREKVSHALAGIARWMNAASTVDRWKEIIEP